MGRNFSDPIPLDDLPTNVEAGGSLAGASLTSKSQTTMMLPSVSSAFSDVYEEYVPRLVPRAPRTFRKRGRADSSSSTPSTAKKSRQSSTRPGTPVVGSVLVGEHINMFFFLWFVCAFNRVLFSFFRWFYGCLA